MVSFANRSASFLAGFPVVVMGISFTVTNARGCQNLGSICSQMYFVSVRSSSVESITTISPNFLSCRLVMRKGVLMCCLKMRSTSSICIFTPPLTITLSFLPMMRNLPSCISAMSLVLSVSEQTYGALIIRHPSSASDMLTDGNGVYQSLASSPLNLLNAMCESVSVIPYVLHTA